MYEKEIREVRNEIGDARKYLEELTTEVMIRKLCENYFHSCLRQRTAQRSNSICISLLITLTTATVNLNCRIKRIPAGATSTITILFRILCVTVWFTASRFSYWQSSSDNSARVNLKGAPKFPWVIDNSQSRTCPSRLRNVLMIVINSRNLLEILGSWEPFTCPGPVYI